jgi:hypothetical protein
MCIAFDLIFFRQWIGYPPHTNITIFLTNTYDTNVLDDSYKALSRDLSGHIKRADNVAVFDNIASFGGGVWKPMFVKLPVHYNTYTDDMDGGAETFVDLPSDSDNIPKQDVFVRRIYDITPAVYNEIDILPTSQTYDFRDAFPRWGDELFFNGGLMSTCVNYYDEETFKLNQLERPVFYKNTDSNTRSVNFELQDTITDDSPLQSPERGGAFLYDSRYLILGNEDRHTIKTGMRSLKPRWCDGPINGLSRNRPGGGWKEILTRWFRFFRLTICFL